jgi:hypothetical protein
MYCSDPSENATVPGFRIFLLILGFCASKIDPFGSKRKVKPRGRRTKRRPVKPGRSRRYFTLHKTGLRKRNSSLTKLLFFPRKFGSAHGPRARPTLLFFSVGQSTLRQSEQPLNKSRIPGRETAFAAFMQKSLFEKLNFVSLSVTKYDSVFALTGGNS